MPQRKTASLPHKPVRIIPEKIRIMKITVSNAQVNGSSDAEDSWKEVAMKIDANTFFNERIGCKVVLIIDLFKVHEDPILQIKANFTIEFNLEIENLDDFKVHTAGNEFQLDSRLGATILGIVYSTARGIILTRTAGTILQGIILPVIDPSTLLT